MKMYKKINIYLSLYLSVLGCPFQWSSKSHHWSCIYEYVGDHGGGGGGHIGHVWQSRASDSASHSTSWSPSSSAAAAPRE